MVFDAFITGHEVNIDLGDIKVSGEVQASTDLDLTMPFVDDVFEESNGSRSVVHIAVCY